MRLSRLLAGVVAGPIVTFVLALSATLASAQYTSDRPIRLIVPFSPGSGTDVAARILIEPLAEALKRPIVVDNKPGALGTIGTDAAAKAAPDGHTLVMIGGSAISSAPFMIKNLPYDPVKDLAPIYFLASSPLALWVAQDSPFKTMDDLVRASKAQPGKLTYGAHVATNMLAMELLKQATGMDLLHIRYKSAPQGLNDVAGGVVTAMFADLTGASPLARAGKIRPLALMKKTRAPSFPDLPTVYELGYTGHEMINWTGLFAPAQTPPAIVELVAREVARIAARPDIREKFERVGLELHQGGTPAAFADAIRQEMAVVGPVVKKLGIEAE